MTHSSATPHAVSSAAASGPVLPFLDLDVLWLQITGTVCNIACRHCFITCGPHNQSHPMMATAEVLALLDEARQLGVKEYYFTGGEPLMHPDVVALCRATLAQGPLTILTNGMLVDAALAAALAQLEAGSDYSLELRVSLDGTSAAENDPIRGRGTFEQILNGAQHLERAGLHPVFSVTTVDPQHATAAGAAHFLDVLRALGFARPRLKLIPPFRIGREARRSAPYAPVALLRAADLAPDEEHVLQCGSCRAVTAKGVYPCPILIEEAGARMGGRLSEGLRPIRLNHPACLTCHVEGFSCRT